MRSVRHVLVAVSGLVVLVAATVVITGEPARAARVDDVRVVNTAAEPVPTTMSNTSATPEIQRPTRSMFIRLPLPGRGTGRV